VDALIVYDMDIDFKSEENEAWHYAIEIPVKI
jgi:hypothetical protein